MKKKHNRLLQVCRARGLSLALIIALMLSCSFAWAQTLPLPHILQAEYFFDVDPGPGRGIPIPISLSTDSIDLNVSASIAHLDPGYHKMVIRVKDEVFGWSTAQEHLFHVNPLLSPIVPLPPPFTLVAAEYFIDTDPGPGYGTSLPLIAGDSVSIIRNISSTGLAYGAHTVGVRFKDLAGNWSTIETYPIQVFQDSLNLAGPQADFSWSTPIAGQPVQFTNLSSGLLPGRKFQWDIDADGTVDYTSRNIQHTFSQPGIYDVLMRVSNPGTLVDTADLLGLYRFYNASRLNYHGPLGELIKQGDIERTDGRHGDPFGAWSTQGVNQVSALTSASSTNLGIQELSVSYWFKGNVSDYLFNLLDDNNNGVRSTLSSRHYVLSNSSPSFSAQSLNDQSWHHVAFTWTPDSSQGFKSYLDGQLLNSGTASNFNLIQLDSLSLGANGLNQASGSFDDVFIFSRVLSDAEVFTLYNEAITDIIVKQIIVGPLPANEISSSGLDTICSGDSLVLSGPTGSAYLWSTGATTQQIVVKESGHFICTYTDVHGNSRTSDTKHIVVNESPDIQAHISTATNGMANGSINLDISGGSGVYSVSWTNGAQGAQIVQLTPGTYQATVDDGNCPQTIVVVVPDTTVNLSDEIMAAEAFFDVDPGVGNGMSIPVPQLNQIDCHLDIPASNLTPGGHFLYTRVLQKNGTWSALSRSYFFVNDTAAEVPQPNMPLGDIVAAEFYFDVDPGPANGYALAISPTDTFVNVNLGLQTQNLSIGIHTLAVRVKDSYGHWSVIADEDILIDVVPPPNLPAFRLPIVAAEYFFDDQDPGTGNALPLNIPVQDSSLDVNRSVDISGLSVGTHELNVRVKDVRGQWSTIQQNAFDVDNSCTPPVALFSYGNAQSGSPVSFTNTSSGLSPLAMYYWDIDADGTVEYSTANIQHTFSSAGVYSVRLSVVNLDSCYSEIVQSIVVGPLPSAQITASGPLTFCSGDTLSLTAPTGSNYIWNTLDTVDEIKVSSSGSFWASYIDSQGRLRQTDVVTVGVSPSMDIQFQIAAEINGLSNGGIRLFVSGGSTFDWDIQWSTGDTTTMISNKPAGNYEVTVDDGYCPQTLQMSIPSQTQQPLNGIVAAEYILDDVDPGIGFGQSMVVNPGAISNSMTQISTQGLTTGVHKIHVRLLNSDGQWSHLSHLRFFTIEDSTSIDTSTAPIVAMEYFFDEDHGPGTGTVVPGVTSVNNIDLTFSASVASLRPGPHTFYTRAKDGNGFWSFVKERIIYVDSFPTIPSVDWPIVEAEYFLGSDPGAGNGIHISLPVADSIDLNRIIDVSSLAPGSYTYHLRIKDQSGLWNHLTAFDLIILPSNCIMPQAAFAYTNAVAGQPASFFNTSSNLLPSATVAWDFGADGSIDYTTDNVSHVFANPGLYDVMITVDNGSGCFQQHMEHIAVGPLPGTNISMIGDAEFCACDSLILTAPSGDTYQWNTGETTASISVHTSGLFNVVVSDANGNSVMTSSIQSIARPKPIITSQVSPAYNGAADGTAAVTSAQGGTGYLYTYYWSTGDSTRSISDLAAGTYWVSVSDGYCTVIDTLIVQDVQMNPLSGIVEAEYFFGSTDPGVGDATPLNYGYGSMVSTIESIPTSGLTPGIHQMWIRVKQDDGIWSTVKRHYITLSDTVAPLLWPDTRIAEVEYFIDTDGGPSSGTLIASGLSKDHLDSSFALTMPVLIPGLHEVAIRVKDELGNWSAVQVHDINNCVPPSIPLAGADIDVCPSDTIHLMSIFNGPEAVYWLGPNGSTYSGKTPSIWASDSSFEGYYLVYSEGAGNCRSPFDTVYVDVVTPPVNPGDIVLNPTAICAATDTVNLFVNHQNDASTYQWLLPPGAFILAGNNTNGVTVDLSNWNDSSAIVQVIVSNSCGSDTSNALALTRCGNVLPVVATSASYAVSGSSAATGGIVVNPGASPVIRAGVCISTQIGPDTTDRVLEVLPNMTSFNIGVNGLNGGSTYYVRAFAENTQGVSYGNELSFTTPTDCQALVDSISTVNFNQGVFSASWSSLANGATGYTFQWRAVGEINWRSKSAGNSNSTSQRFNITPWFNNSIEYRLGSEVNGNLIWGCTNTFEVDCKPMIVSAIELVSPFCAGDSALLKVVVNGGYKANSILWNTGQTTRFIYGQQGQTYTVTVTDEAGCSDSASVTVSSVNTQYTPLNFAVGKPNAVTFTGTWSAAALGSGVNLIGYRMLYRQVGVGAPWTSTALTTNTTTTVNFTGSGLPSANYEFTVFARVNDNGSIYNTENACKGRRFYNGSGNKNADNPSSLNSSSNGIHIYPNPTSGLVYVSATAGSLVQLTDMQGRILHEQQIGEAEWVFDLSNYAKGVYLIKLVQDGSSLTEQIIKQ